MPRGGAEGGRAIVPKGGGEEQLIEEVSRHLREVRLEPNGLLVVVGR
jgi:hypothetical protein